MAAGGADFCLTSVTHYLTARARSGDLAARFVAAVVRRSPMAGFVPAGSPLSSPADLAGRRLAGPEGSRLVAELNAAMAELGLDPPTLVPRDYALAPAAMARGEADMVCDFVDLLPRIRRQAGIAVRPVALGLDVYSSGLVAADRVPDDVVDRMRAALSAALERQRAEPRAGLDELARRYPGVDPLEALEGWSLVEPNIFTGPPPGAGEPEAWARTIDHLARAYGLAAPSLASVVRAELADMVPKV